MMSPFLSEEELCDLGRDRQHIPRNFHFDHIQIDESDYFPYRVDVKNKSKESHPSILKAREYSKNIKCILLNYSNIKVSDLKQEQSCYYCLSQL
jgi:hypothetical protein